MKENVQLILLASQNFIKILPLIHLIVEHYTPKGSSILNKSFIKRFFPEIREKNTQINKNRHFH